MRSGVLAQKIGMTRLFTDSGEHVPVTVLRLGNCQVVGHRTKEKNGYIALQLGAGLRKECKEIYPSRAFVALMFQKGIPITFGSDAHAIQEVGLNFSEAVQLAREVGYTESRAFAGRRHAAVPLSQPACCS